MKIEAVIDEVITQENNGDCLQPIIGKDNCFKQILTSTNIAKIDM